jgi:hypothetical protein
MIRPAPRTRLVEAEAEGVLGQRLDVVAQLEFESNV